MGKAKKNKIYTPNPRFNPVVMGKKLEKLEEDLEHHKNLLLAVNKANSLHVEHLSNFVRHDMKNAIMGMDGTLYNAKRANLIPDEIQNQLDTVLKLLKSSLDNFTKLIPSSRNRTTTLSEVFNAVEMLSRSEMLNKNIEAIFDYDRQSTDVINYSFQSLVQIIHNLVINSYNAVLNQPYKKILLKGTVCTDKCSVCVYDNGLAIAPDKRDVIFNYGYSTTGGSGVGLFHARSIVNEMKGTITVIDSDLPDYTKCFVIEFNPQQKVL